MVTGPTVDDMLRWIEQRLLESAPDQRRRLVGIVFCRPQLRIAKEEIIPHLLYYHVRAGMNVDFFFAGFMRKCIKPSLFTYEIDGPGGHKWFFDERSFNEFRARIEADSAWHYSGGNDLILANASYDEETKTTTIDLRSAVCMNFEDVKRREHIAELGQILENIFRYAENPLQDDPVSGFSDQMGAKLGLAAAKSIFVALLPTSIQEHATAAFSYATRDMRRAAGEVGRLTRQSS